MSKCTCNNCELEAFKKSDKCVLHVEKNGYSQDFDEAGLLRGFYEELLNYIVNDMSIYKNEDKEVTKKTIKEYLKSKPEDVVNSVSSLVSQSTVVFTEIVFPGRDSRDAFDYLRILRNLKKIHFNCCDFKVNSIELNETKCFYKNCNFYDKWYISDTLLLNNVNKVLYQNCIFLDDLSTNNDVSDKNYGINVSLFNDCEFNKNISFFNTDFSEPIFNNTLEQGLSLNEFSIDNCNINGKFILNGCNIKSFISDNSVFNEKFEFKNNTVKYFRVFNTNYLKLVDAFETSFHKFIIKKSIFENFVGFEKCIFGLENENSFDYKAVFLYATFLSFINFRNTIFHGGLDLENINLKESPNFLNTKVTQTHTNRETFRIIKNSFDKIGNHIEANKFFVHEMKKYKECVISENKFQKKMILFFNEIISDFGQSYIRPFIWMVLFSSVYYFLVLGYENNTLYNIYLPANDIIRSTSEFLNGISKNILPFKNFLKPDMEFVSLFFYIIFSSLVWQFVVAIKRHTRR